MFESEAVTSFPLTFWPLPHPHGGAAAGLSTMLLLSTVVMVFDSAILDCTVLCC